MAIQIKIEPAEITKAFHGVTERCHFCRTRTKFWHEASNTPICPKCAAVEKEVSDIIKNSNLKSKKNEQ